MTDHAGVPVNPESIDFQFLNSFKEIDWKEFFSPQSFFVEHKFFIQIQVMTLSRKNGLVFKDEEKHHTEYKGFIESRLRYL